MNDALRPNAFRRRRTPAHRWRGLLFVAPAMALVLVFFVLPLVHDLLDVAAQLAAAGQPALHRARATTSGCWTTRGSGGAAASPSTTRWSSRSRSSPSPSRWRSSSRRSGGWSPALPHGLLPARRRRLRLGLPALGLARQRRLPACSRRAMIALGLASKPRQPAGRVRHHLLVDHRHGRVEDRRLQHDHPADRPAGHPDRGQEAARIDGAATLAALPPHHAAADAPHHRAGADPLGHRLDARLRPVLHHRPTAARRTARSRRSTGSSTSPSCRSTSATARRCPWCCSAILVAISVVQLRLLRDAGGHVMASRRSAHRGARRVALPRHRRRRGAPLPRAASPGASSPQLQAAAPRRGSRRCRPGRSTASARRLREPRHFGAGIWQPTPATACSCRWRRSLLTVVVSLLAGYGFSRFRFPFKNVLFVLIISTVMIPFQSILTPLFLDPDQARAAELADRADAGLRDAAAAVLDLHDAQRLRRGAEGDRGGGARRRRARPRRCCAASCCRWCCRASSRWRSSPSSRLERVPGGADPAVRPDEKYTLPVLMTAVRAGQLRHDRLGRGAGRRHGDDGALPRPLPAAAALLHPRPDGGRGQVNADLQRHESDRQIHATSALREPPNVRAQASARLAVPDVDVRGFWGERHDAVATRTAAILYDRCVEAGHARPDRSDRPVPSRGCRSTCAPIGTPGHGQRPDVLGLRHRQGRSRPSPTRSTASPTPSSRRGSTRSSTCMRALQAAGRLPQHLVQPHAARPALDQPARLPRALLRRPPDRGRRRLLPGHRQAQAPRRHVPLCRPHRRGLRPAAPARRRGYCGHEEIELALVKLARVTGEQRYLDLARLLRRRARPAAALLRPRRRSAAARPGSSSHKTYEYNQSHLPVREQTQGRRPRRARHVPLFRHGRHRHRVRRRQPDRRAGGPVGRPDHQADVRHRRHRPGGSNEGFTDDYDLPNESAYAETCASVGLVFWASRMLGRGPDRALRRHHGAGALQRRAVRPLARRPHASSTTTRSKAAATITAGPGIAARAARPTSPASSPRSAPTCTRVADDEIAVHLYGESTARFARRRHARRR